MQTSNVIVVVASFGAAIAAAFLDHVAAALAHFFERRHARHVRAREAR